MYMSHAFPSAFAGRIKQRRPPRNARDRGGRLSRLAVAHAAPRAAGGRAGGRAVRGGRAGRGKAPRPPSPTAPEAGAGELERRELRRTRSAVRGAADGRARRRATVCRADPRPAAHSRRDRAVDAAPRAGRCRRGARRARVGRAMRHSAPGGSVS